MSKRWPLFGLLTAASVAVLTGACTSSQPSTVPVDASVAAHVCTPGQQVGCVCPGGATGAQVCTPDGLGYGTCVGCAAESDATISVPDGSDQPDVSVPDGSDQPDVSAQGGDSGDASTTDAGGTCPTGLTCNVACDGAKTTVSGKVLDPAGKNPVFNAFVYVPSAPLSPLPKGVPTGADACSCGALFPSGALAYTTTQPDGTFVLSNVPAGSHVPLVVQIGKWRRAVTINVDPCVTNAQPAGSLTLPGTVAAGGTDDNMPDIAVSTGGADSLECLLLRMGIPASEYVAGASPSGHVHVFSGGKSPAGGGGGVGVPEANPITGAPQSPTSLWSTQAQLMPYDAVLLSCEGGETYGANPAVLEQYLNAGGRALASHYHYPWFSGPLGSGQSYTAPADWGTNLASWAAGSASAPDAIGGIVDTTLNGGTTPFPKGALFEQWLADAGALGQNGVPAGELSIYQARYNATVGATNTHSQPWIVSDPSGQAGATMHFSFNTPVNAAGPSCGRAMFSDLHVSGNPMTNDTVNTSGGSPPPAGCAGTSLSPQELALEFMLFDLSGCVTPDSAAIPTAFP